MSRIYVAAMTCLALCGMFAYGQVTKSAAITGTLFDKGPVVDAEIDLQSLDDEECAKLFVAKVNDAGSRQKLEGCTHDVATAHPDAGGHYHFSGLVPGWYAIHFVWSMAEKPSHPRAFNKGEWVVAYPGYRDHSGKYDAFAQGKPFRVSRDADAVKDYRNP